MDFDDCIPWGIGAFVVALIALVIWAAIAEDNQWEKFKAENHCRETGIIKGSTSMGTGIGSKGEVTIIPISEPDKHIYICDGNYQVIR
jgi:hypothetical protein